MAIDGLGILLRGPSGAGKSDLALRLIDSGAVLVADDQVEIEQRGDGLEAGPPERLAGLMEVRGLGILPFTHLPRVPLALVVDLVADDAVERLPEPRHATILGVALPLVALDPRQASAPAKLRLAVRMAGGGIMAAR